jgi:hypothetical protein
VYRALREAPDTSMIVDAAHEAFISCCSDLEFRPLVVGIATLNEAGNRHRGRGPQPDADRSEMVRIAARGPGRLHIRQACAVGPDTDDPDRMARWRLYTAFHALQEGGNVSYWPRYAHGRLWWSEGLAARLIASTTSGQSAGAAAEIRSGPPADLGAQVAAKPRFSRWGIAWPIAAAVAFTLAALTFDSLRVPLFWDESVYASQISQHMPLLWGAERSRGMPLLVAPVTLLTSSVVVLRVYLVLMAGIGLLLAMLAWRGRRPDWVVALAGVIFGGLWITQWQASLLLPNYWTAIGGMAGVGLFLRAMERGRTSPPGIVLLAVTVAFTTLMRLPDAIVIFVPLLVIAIAARPWRQAVSLVAAVAGAIVTGLAVGIGEWVAESYLYFGGPLTRLHATSRASGGSKLDLLNNLRIMSGGVVSSVPGFPSIRGWSYPPLVAWWAAFGVLALIGVYAAHRYHGWLLAATPVICALCVYALYSLPVRDNTRYLLPIWALLAVPAADAIYWLVTTPRGRVRLAAIAAASLFVVVELGTQHVVLASQNAQRVAEGQSQTDAVQAIRRLGVRPPCVVTSSRVAVSLTVPAAYYLGCSYVPNMRYLAQADGHRVVVLIQGRWRPQPFAQPWPAHRLPRTAGNVVGYVQPRRL